MATDQPTAAVRYCKTCGIEKPETDFPRYASRQWRTELHCKKCFAAKTKARQQANPEKASLARRKSYAIHRKKRCAERREYYQAMDPEVRVEKRREQYIKGNEREAVAKARKKDPEKFRAVNRRVRERNPDYHKRHYAEVFKINPERFRTYVRMRRAKRRAAEGVHTPADIMNIRAKQRDRCAACHIKLDGKGEVDHIVPTSRGGSEWPKNLQILCCSCNRTKSNRDAEEFMRSLGRLL